MVWIYSNCVGFSGPESTSPPPPRVELPELQLEHYHRRHGSVRFRIGLVYPGSGSERTMKSFLCGLGHNLPWLLHAHSPDYPVVTCPQTNSDSDKYISCYHHVTLGEQR